MVALVGSYPLDSNQIKGGVQASYAYLLRGLSRIENLEMHVITFAPSGWTGLDLIEQDRVTIHLLPSIPRFERLRNYRTYQSYLSQKLAQIKPDVVHAQEAAADAYVALAIGSPIVITAHGIRHEDRKFSRSWNQRLRFYFDSVLIERSVLRCTRHLIAISRYVTEYFAPLLQPDAHIYNVPNAIDDHFFKLSGNAKGHTVLFAGRITPLKCVMDLVQAFARVFSTLPSAQLRIAGECRTDVAYSKAIRRWIDQNNLGEHIHLLGELNQEAILQEYDRCDVFVLPSAQENSPMVIAQAMAAGKPVVATLVGGIPEMVGETGERGLLVKVGDINGLSNSMVQLLQDPTLSSKLGREGHAFALENYHQDRVAQRTYEVYQQIEARESKTNV